MRTETETSVVIPMPPFPLCAQCNSKVRFMRLAASPFWGSVLIKICCHGETTWLYMSQADLAARVENGDFPAIVFPNDRDGARHPV